MPTGTLKFTRIMQNSQDLGTDDEHMVSRIFFDLDVEGRKYPGLHADIKQTVGTSYAEAPIEVSPPANYKGPLNYEAYRREVEVYYREAVGASGSAFRIQGGAQVFMRDNLIVKPKEVEIDIAGHVEGW